MTALWLLLVRGFICLFHVVISFFSSAGWKLNENKAPAGSGLRNFCFIKFHVYVLARW
mgnify:CR=1